MSCKDRNINFNSGFNGCNDKISILKNEVVQRDLGEFKEITSEDVNINSYIYVDQNGDPSKIKLGDVITANAEQADWNETDESSYAFIKNKPELKLNEPLISLYNIGGITEGQIFEEGTSIIDIMKELLTVSHPSMFRFGLVDADENNLFPVDFDISKLTEVEVNTADLIKYGFNPSDAKWSDLFPEFGDGIALKNQFFTLAIPNDSIIQFDKCYQEGYAIELAPYRLNDAWTLYLNADDIIIEDHTTYQYLPVTTIAPGLDEHGSKIYYKVKFDYKFKLR